MGLFSQRESRPEALTAAAAPATTVAGLPEGLTHAYSSRAQAAPFNQPRSLTASAQRIRLTDRTQTEEIRQRHTMTMAWQEQGWRIFDGIGEVSFAYNLVASVLSRVRIHAAVLVDPEAPPTEITDAMVITDPDGNTHGTPGGIDPRVGAKAREVMADLIRCNMPAMLRTFALNTLTPGECYLALINGKWGIYSTSEIRIDASGQPMHYPSASTANALPRRLPKNTLIGRIWNQHPRYSMDPTSALRAVIDDCEELLLLNRMVRATARSRLNAGILFMPDTMSVAADTPGEGEDPESTEVDPLEQELFTLATTPIADEAAASTVTPMLVRGPATEGEKIRHISFSREGDQWLLQRIKEVLDRILNGIDAPKEKVTGSAQVKYANARLINEDLYKAHVEPLALMFVDAVTEIYFRPIMYAVAAAEGWDRSVIDRLVVWYDPSEITTRPDRGQDANEGFDRMVVSERAWRAAHGFGDTDAPTEKELARRVAMKAIPPQDVLEALFKAALPEILGAARAANGGSSMPADLQALLEGESSQVQPAAPLPPTGDGTGPVEGAPAVLPAPGQNGQPQAVPAQQSQVQGQPT